MTFEKFWNAIKTRNRWQDDTTLSVKASGVEKLAAKAYQTGYSAGVEAAKKSTPSDQLNDFLRTGRL